MRPCKLRRCSGTAGVSPALSSKGAGGTPAVPGAPAASRHEHNHNNFAVRKAMSDIFTPCALRCVTIATLLAGSLMATGAAAQNAGCPGPMRKINVGVSVSPPNVVHTTIYVAKELGLFAKHCIDANVIQFD